MYGLIQIPYALSGQRRDRWTIERTWRETRLTPSAI